MKNKPAKKAVKKSSGVSSYTGIITGEHLSGIKSSKDDKKKTKKMAEGGKVSDKNKK